MWTELTSLYVLQSYETTEKLADQIAYYTKFSLSKDSLLVINLSIDLHQTRGKFSNLFLLEKLMAGR
ncbi:hypothetical protein QFZ27_000160 [Inquilinus ginsengisoli]